MSTESIPLLTIGQDDLHRAIVAYIADSRTGHTLSYRETAELPADQVATSGTIGLWAYLKAQPNVTEAMSGQVTELAAESVPIALTLGMTQQLVDFFGGAAETAAVLQLDSTSGQLWAELGGERVPLNPTKPEPVAVTVDSFFGT